MARPRATELTERELEIMQVFWKGRRIDGRRGSRTHWPRLGRDLAYTTVATLVRILTDKDFVKQTNDERPFRYRNPLLRRRLRPPAGRSGEARLRRLAGTPACAADRGPQVDGQRAGPARKNSAGATAMNHSGQVLLWCVLQITVLSIVAMAIGAIIGRRRPSAGALVAGAGFVAVIGLSLAAFSPWPTWKISRDSFGWHDASSSKEVNIDRPAFLPVVERSAIRAADDRTWDDISATNPSTIRKLSVSFWERSREFAADHWGICAFLLYLIGVGVMALHMGWGLATVRDYRRRSRPITDRGMTELVEVVSAELSCSRDIELREAAGLGTPATIGWRRPILLLPSDWSSWTHEERLAVLAHEIEHIRRGDFLSWIMAQIGVTLHFYHPFVHALAARLLPATRVVGGRSGRAGFGRTTQVRRDPGRDGVASIRSAGRLAGPSLFAHFKDFLEENRDASSVDIAARRSVAATRLRESLGSRRGGDLRGGFSRLRRRRRSRSPPTTANFLSPRNHSKD